MGRLVDVSVIIPARDEAESVGVVVDAVRETLLADPGVGNVEILVVDDGSADATAERATAAGATVVRVDTRRGYGAALKRGLRRAKHETVVILDADGTYPVEAIPDLIGLLGEGADHAVGARCGDDVRVPLLRRPVKWLVNRFACWLTGKEIPDLNSGMRAFRRNDVLAIQRLLPSGFSFTTTVTVAALLSGLEVAWLPIAYRQRVGSSKFRAVRDTARLLLALVRAVVYFDPLRVFLPVVVVLGATATALGAWDVVVERNLTDKTVLFTLSAIEVAVLGLLADLIVRRR